MSSNQCPSRAGRQIFIEGDAGSIIVVHGPRSVNHGENQYLNHCLVSLNKGGPT